MANPVLAILISPIFGFSIFGSGFCDGGALEGGATKGGGAQNFAFFLPSICLSGVFSWFVGGVWKRQSPNFEEDTETVNGVSVDDEGGFAATPVEVHPMIERPVRGFQGAFVWCVGFLLSLSLRISVSLWWFFFQQSRFHPPSQKKKSFGWSRFEGSIQVQSLHDANSSLFHERSIPVGVARCSGRSVGGRSTSGSWHIGDIERVDEEGSGRRPFRDDSGPTSSPCWTMSTIPNCCPKQRHFCRRGPSQVLDGLRLGRLTALRKPDGGVRGIVVGDVMRRLVARTMAKQVAKLKKPLLPSRTP